MIPCDSQHIPDHKTPQGTHRREYRHHMTRFHWMTLQLVNQISGRTRLLAFFAAHGVLWSSMALGTSITSRRRGHNFIVKGRKAEQTLIAMFKLELHAMIYPQLEAKKDFHSGVVR